MHRALLIPEIVEPICLDLGPYPPSWLPCEETRDLANLARTSALFLNAALDVLWEVQYGLYNILRCMPEDLWDGQPIRLRSLGTLNATRPITAADWERPLFYLSRIREFEGGHPQDMASIKLFTELCSTLPTRHWFPNLRILEWCCHNPALLPGFPMIAPRPTKLRVSRIGNRGDLSALARGVDGRLLTNVSIGCHDSGADAFRTRISPFIRSMARLQRLRIHDLDQAAFEHLAMLPSLESLKIAKLEDEPFSAVPQLDAAAPFSGLKELEITTRTVQTALVVIASVSGPLTSIDVYIKDWNHKTPMAEVSRLFATLRSTTPQLRKLGITLEPDTPSYHQTLNAALEHLFRLRNLEKVSLTAGEGWDLDNALVIAMARAWPNLTALHLRPDLPTHVTRRLTLTALRAFALHCPKLSVLGLDIDARVPLEDLPTAKDAQRSLTTLCLGYSPIADSSVVASALFIMFPELSHIMAEDRNDGYWSSSCIHDDIHEGQDIHKLSRTFYKRWKGVQNKLAEKQWEESELELEAQ
ncbi:hypothetical protein B0H19DRAFT_189546 [Mycena capillaripes]|nr:hypothetical protein B0H19DRAFT_189546 [Mycena capillaripes]